MFTGIATLPKETQLHTAQNHGFRWKRRRSQEGGVEAARTGGDVKGSKARTPLLAKLHCQLLLLSLRRPFVSAGGFLLIKAAVICVHACVCVCVRAGEGREKEKRQRKETVMGMRMRGGKSSVRLEASLASRSPAAEYSEPHPWGLMARV